MERLSFDLHLHSCLSPCGGEDNTPAALAGMCALAGINVVALTDHNTCGSCAPFCRAAEYYGVLALPGMELTCAEEAHVVCLFPDLAAAEAFGALVREKLPPIQNRPAVFGPQIYMDEEDRVLGEETAFLAGAASIGIPRPHRPGFLFPPGQSGALGPGHGLPSGGGVPELPPGAV